MKVQTLMKVIEANSMFFGIGARSCPGKRKNDLDQKHNFANMLRSCGGNLHKNDSNAINELRLELYISRKREKY